jgi:hypothetical protein
MLKDGFLRFCDDPELACCRGEAELGRLREENVRLRYELQESQRRERAAVEDMKRIVDNVRETHCDETCCFACKFDCDTSITDSGCYANECPGFERDDCFEWRGPQAADV